MKNNTLAEVWVLITVENDPNDSWYFGIDEEGEACMIVVDDAMQFARQQDAETFLREVVYGIMDTTHEWKAVAVDILA